jgi:hypothetical protein
MHAGSIHWLHGQWRIAVEGIVVLNGGLVMVGVVGSAIVPASRVVIKMILVVMLLVVHLQLAHSLVAVGSSGARWSCVSVRGWGGREMSVSDAKAKQRL